MSGDGQNMNSILLELEAAIKNSYMSEFENFIQNIKYLKCNNNFYLRFFGTSSRFLHNRSIIMSITILQIV